jgi:hypothetical protein
MENHLLLHATAVPNLSSFRSKMTRNRWCCDSIREVGEGGEELNSVYMIAYPTLGFS